MPWRSHLGEALPPRPEVPGPLMARLSRTRHRRAARQGTGARWLDQVDVACATDYPGADSTPRSPPSVSNMGHRRTGSRARARGRREIHPARHRARTRPATLNPRGSEQAHLSHDVALWMGRETTQMLAQEAAACHRTKECLSVRRACARHPLASAPRAARAPPVARDHRGAACARWMSGGSRPSLPSGAAWLRFP